MRQPEGVVTVFDFLIVRFPQIPPETWLQRVRDGHVVTDAGPIEPSLPYRPGLDVRYWREVEEEPPVRTDVDVVWRDQHLLVVDKPAFLPVTPGGRYVRSCLVTLLEERLGLEHLAPLHRLDKDTSGLVVLSLDPRSRGHYSGLFQGAGPRLAKTYLAECEVQPGTSLEPRWLRHHLSRDPQHHWRQCAVPERQPNAFTSFDVVEARGGRALVRLGPISGRKHQLRVQLAAEGLPIVGDRLYGAGQPPPDENLDRPLRLHCSRLAVADFPRFGDGLPQTFTWCSEYPEWLGDASA